MENDEELLNGDIKESKRRKNLIYAAATVVAVLAIAAIMGLFKAEGAKQMAKVFCDAFFATGVLFCGVGILSWIGKGGSFDIFSYSAKVVGYKFKPKAKLDSYYDYKQEKEKKRKPWLKELAFCGAVGILLSVAVLVVYNSL